MVWKERYRPEIDSSVPKAVQSVITQAWTQNATNRPPMITIESFLESLVFIDGLEGENDVLDTDMSTVMSPTDVKIVTPLLSPKRQLNSNTAQNFPAMKEIQSVPSPRLVSVSSNDGQLQRFKGAQLPESGTSSKKEKPKIEIPRSSKPWFSRWEYLE